MAVIRRFLFVLCTIMLETMIVKPVQSQIFEPISVALFCTTARMTSRVDPVTTASAFSWFLNDGSQNVNLAVVALSSGTVGVTLRQNAYSGRYNVTNVPMTLDPPDQNFDSILYFDDLMIDETFVFILDPNGRNVRSENVSRERCFYPEDLECTDDCLTSTFCGVSFTKLCKDGRSILQDCPGNFSSCVQCKSSFLDDLNATTDPPTSMVNYSEVVIVQCKPGYEGNDVEYQCNSTLVPVNGINISCSPVQCDQSFLADLNAEVNPSASVIVYSDNVTVQCKPNYVENDVIYQCDAERNLVPVGGVAIKCSDSHIVLIVCCVVGGILIGVGIGLIIYYCVNGQNSPAVLHAALLVMDVRFLLIGVGLVVGLPDDIAAVVCGSIIIAGGIIEGFVSILLFGGCIKSSKEKFAKGERSRSTSIPEETKELATTYH